MEGNKNRRKLTQDCRAVSELIGQVLMIAIVVLAFSSISLAVFSDGGAMNPPHTPHTDLQENIDTSENTVQVFHSGGEAIDLEDVKIILNVNGQQAEFITTDPGVEVRTSNGSLMSDDDVFMLGDYIVIDTDTKGIDIKNTDAVDFYFVHTASSQVIQKTALQRGYGDIPYWITPHPYGTVKDYSAGDNTGEWIPTELVDGINDGILTECEMKQNQDSYEIFTFGIDADEMGITEPFKEVLLKIVYIAHDSSQKDLKLEINDGNPNSWVTIDPDLFEYKDLTKCDQELGPYNITSNVTTIAELENLSVKITATGVAASDNKIGWVDFVGIHVEY